MNADQISKNYVKKAMMKKMNQPERYYLPATEAAPERKPQVFGVGVFELYQADDDTSSYLFPLLRQGKPGAKQHQNPDTVKPTFHGEAAML